MRYMLRKQIYFAVISFVVLCVGLSVAHFVFGFSISFGLQQSPVAQPSTTISSDSKPSFWLSAFIVTISLTMIVVGSCLFYLSWFKGNKVRENLEKTRELAQQGELISLRHNYSNINTTAYLWFMRFFSPIIIFIGLILFAVVLNGFREVVFSCC